MLLKLRIPRTNPNRFPRRISFFQNRRHRIALPKTQRKNRPVSTNDSAQSIQRRTRATTPNRRRCQRSAEGDLGVEEGGEEKVKTLLR